MAKCLHSRLAEFFSLTSCRCTKHSYHHGIINAMSTVNAHAQKPPEPQNKPSPFRQLYQKWWVWLDRCRNNNHPPNQPNQWGRHSHHDQMMWQNPMGSPFRIIWRTQFGSRVSVNPDWHWFEVFLITSSVHEEPGEARVIVWINMCFGK